MIIKNEDWDLYIEKPMYCVRNGEVHSGSLKKRHTQINNLTTGQAEVNSWFVLYTPEYHFMGGKTGGDFHLNSDDILYDSKEEAYLGCLKTLTKEEKTLSEDLSRLEKRLSEIRGRKSKYLDFILND